MRIIRASSVYRRRENVALGTRHQAIILCLQPLIRQKAPLLLRRPNDFTSTYRGYKAGVPNSNAMRYNLHIPPISDRKRFTYILGNVDLLLSKQPLVTGVYLRPVFGYLSACLDKLHGHLFRLKRCKVSEIGGL